MKNEIQHLKGRWRFRVLPILIIVLIAMFGGMASAAPVATFNATPDTGFAPLLVSFNSSGSTTVNTTFTWEFEPGIFGGSLNPTYTFNTAGNWTVRLNVTDVVDGTYQNAEKGVVVYPVAQFTVTPNPANANQTVQFTDTSTGNPDNWTWVFGDGTTISGPSHKNPTHVYNWTGNYKVNLTASKNFNSNSTPVATVVTVNPVPSISINPSTGKTLSTTFKMNGTATGGTTVSWKWIFGDGTPNGLSQNVTHSYVVANVYPVTLNVTGNGTSTAQTSVPLTVTPDAEFFANPEQALSGEVIQFVDTSTGGNVPDPIETWLWNFGDGTTSTDQNPTHVYAPGIYTVSLTVTNNGLSDTNTKVGYIRSDSPNLYSLKSIINGNTFFRADRYGLHIGDSLTLIAFSTRGTVETGYVRFGKGLLSQLLTVGGLDPATTYHWTLTGTKNPFNIRTADGRTVYFDNGGGSGHYPKITAADVYTVTLTVTDTRDSFTLTAPRLIVVNP